MPPSGTFAVSELKHGLDQSIRTDTWKLLLHRVNTTDAGRIKLYNIVTDPSELNNVADSNPDIVKTLRTQLTKIVGAAPSYPQVSRGTL